jgi:hypothetical protein
LAAWYCGSDGGQKPLFQRERVKLWPIWSDNCCCYDTSRRNGTDREQLRAFKNGVWCVTSLPWGDECNVTITGSPNAMSVNGGSTTSTGDAKLAMFPNPNNGEQLTVSLSAVEEGVNTISVDIFDLSGARVSSRTIAVNDGMVYQVLSLGEMADGLYMVNITAGSKRYTERLVIG